MSTLITDQIDIAVSTVTWDIPATGNLTMTSGVAAVVQGATIRLKLFAGEWFLNRAQGVAWIARADGTVTAAQAILGQKFDRDKTIRAIRAQLLGDVGQGIAGVPGLIALTQLDVKFNGPTRTLTITWQGKTSFGDTNLNVLPIGGTT